MDTKIKQLAGRMADAIAFIEATLNSGPKARFELESNGVKVRFGFGKPKMWVLEAVSSRDNNEWRNAKDCHIKILSTVLRMIPEMEAVMTENYAAMIRGYEEALEQYDKWSDGKVNGNVSDRTPTDGISFPDSDRETSVS